MFRSKWDLIAVAAARVLEEDPLRVVSGGLRALLVAAAATLLVLLCRPANAAIQLGLLLDESGSITDTDFQFMKQDVVAAVNGLDMSGGNVEITVVMFSTNARLLVQSTSKQSVLNAVFSAHQIGASTNLEAGFNLLTTALTASPNFSSASRQSIGIITDGPPNLGDAVAGRNAAIAAGIDEIDAVLVGPFFNELILANFRDDIVYPQPAHTGTFGPGFFEQVNSFADLRPAVETMLNGEIAAAVAVPEPASAALWSIWVLVGFAFVLKIPRGRTWFDATHP